MSNWFNERFSWGVVDRYRMLEDQLRLQEQIESLASSSPARAHLEEISQATRQAERMAEGLIRAREEDQLRLREQIHTAIVGFAANPSPSLQDLGRAMQQAERFAEGVVTAEAKASEVLESLYEARQQLLASGNLKIIDAMTGALERALSPMGGDHYRDLPKLYGSRDEALFGALRGLNVSIANASFLGATEIALDEEEEDEGGGLGGEELEGQLVQVVPAETLTRLKQVNFEPFLALERIRRSPEAMRSLNSRDFEQFIATLVDKLGFEDVTLTPRSGDGGRDILAVQRTGGIPVIIAFECKCYRADRPIKPDTLRALLGTIMHPQTRANKGVLVTTSRFTPHARSFIITEPLLDGKDFDDIVGWLGECAVRRSGAEHPRG